jgi:hypothetical protein
VRWAFPIRYSFYELISKGSAGFGARYNTVYVLESSSSVSLGRAEDRIHTEEPTVDNEVHMTLTVLCLRP